MTADTKPDDTQAQLAARFAQLPKVVQDAILSADVEKHMRELAASHQLHFDQWTTLENEVMFALLGLQPIDNLAQNIEKQVDVPHEIAVALAGDISRIVFAPIRVEMERNIENREQRVENSGQRTVSGSVPPGTPPPAPQDAKAVRAPISEEYIAGQASHERKTIDGDPYREPAM